MPDEHALIEAEGVSWWSWRPGMRPLYAFLFGGFLTILALFLLVNGVATLITGIRDSQSPPVRVAGVVASHSKDLLGSPQLTIRLQEAGFPAEITLVVSRAASTTLNDGSPVIVDYAQYQRIPYALESLGTRYPLPGASPSGNLWQKLGLLFTGLLLLPYPALLAFWGWRDLRLGLRSQRTAVVVALRAARQTSARAPGMRLRTTGTWHGVALQLEQGAASEPEILVFGIRQELHEELRRGQRVEITYSPHLRHLYTLKVLHNSAK